MNKLNIPTIRTSAKTCTIIGERVLIKVGVTLKGKDKTRITDIVQISQTGVYCSNDEFYPWDRF